MVIYTFDSYKKFLKALVQSRKKVDPHFSYSRLADKIGVQRSYLSRVLKNAASLNPDQLYLLGTELNLNAEDRKYLLLLLEIERCQVPARKIELEADRDKRKKEKLRSESYMQRPSQAPMGDAFGEYYGNPIFPIVHMFLTIPEFLKQPQHLMDRLGISRDTLERSLQVLERCQVLGLEKNGYRLISKDLYLSSHSYLSRMYGVQFRLKSIEYQHKIGNDQDYFFTATFSGNEELRQRLKEKLKELLQWLSPRVENSPSQDVFHINLDLFRI